MHRLKFIITGFIAFIFLAFFINTGLMAYAQVQKKNEIKEDENFTRPEPQRPVQPEVPGVNRYQEDKIFLEYADSLYKQSTKRDTIEKQILKGNVKFRQAGMWMFCDSAYYYPQENSLDAFSNVRMEQGDTLFVYADKLYYEGNLHLAKLKNGPSREKVTLINKDVTLTTDSLDYDMNIDLGWYTRWGTIDDKVNTLTSLYGEYSPATKRAEFFNDVVLVNNRDGFTMLTDTLFYNTETHIAEIESQTVIQSENDTIITNLATYYTDSGDADLLSRSLIIHRDSTGNIITLEGDSIIYDNKTRISRAYMFRDPFKRSNPMVITDTAQKTTLIGGFGLYNDSTKEALATIYPLLLEYSQGDTLFLRADTIKTYIVTHNVVDKRRKTKSGFPEFNGLPIVMMDSLNRGIWIDTSFFKVTIPFIETPLNLLLKATSSFKKSESMKKESPPTNSLPQEASMSENLHPRKESGNINPKLPIALSHNPEEIVKEIAAEDSAKVVDNLKDFIDRMGNQDKDSLNLPGLSKLSRDTIAQDMKDSINFVDDFDPLKIERDSINNEKVNDTLAIEESDSIQGLEKAFVPDSIPVETHVVLAYHRGRFFKQDMQGVADSMVFVERDSMLYMFRKPIVWSGERQVTGNRIDVHFNDSTADWALLPEYGLISEHVEEDFYNQIYGKEITAYFANQSLRRMYVDGNVETIFLPQEEDSTYNRLVNAESSYLDAYLSDNKLERMKMWPEVSGTVTPIFLVKRPQMYLQKFKWWEFLRPQRKWYADKAEWDDNLGEVPEDLEQYFLSPSDFGEPKSFSGPRFTPPPLSLPPNIREETLEEIEENYSLVEEESEEAVKNSEEILEAVKEEESVEAVNNSKDNPEATEMEEEVENE